MIRFGAAALLALLATGCRGNNTGNSNNVVVTAKVNLTGTSGCSTQTPAFGTPVVAFTPQSLAPYVPAPSGAICAKATEPVAFLAIPGPAPGPAILRLDLDAGTMTPFVTADRFAAFDPLVSNLTGIALLNASGIASPDTLLVVDSSTNRILAVTELSISAFAGISSVNGGFADGSVGSALFRFTSPTQIAVGGNGDVYVPDPGNQRVRRITGSFVSTLAGSGVPGFLDGTGTQARFDQPDSIAIECEGTLVVTEGSHRVRRIRFISVSSGFGGSSLSTIVTTVAGDGVANTLDGTLGFAGGAETFAPGCINVGRTGAAAGELFWIDRGSGILRLVASGAATVVSPYGAASVPALSSFGLCGTSSGEALLVDSAGGQILRLP